MPQISVHLKSDNKKLPKNLMIFALKIFHSSINYCNKNNNKKELLNLKKNLIIWILIWTSLNPLFFYKNKKNCFFFQVNKNNLFEYCSTEVLFVIFESLGSIQCVYKSLLQLLFRLNSARTYPNRFYKAKLVLSLLDCSVLFPDTLSDLLNRKLQK